MPYLVIGVLIGVIIHDFIPAEFITSIVGDEHPFAIPIAAIVGVPMYIRVETMIPISEALVMSMGTVIALIIGGAGASLPEVLLLNKLFKPRLLVAFIISIFIGATVTGYILYFILSEMAKEKKIFSSNKDCCSVGIYESLLNNH